MSRFLVTPWGVLLAVALATSTLSAADRAPATTRLADVDEDFAVQGEYFGDVERAHFDADYMGLQVVALGKAKFYGALLKGGLPGGGWNRQDVVKLTGKRVDDTLRLEGSQYRVLVSASQAEIQTSAGATLATLPKIHRVSTTLDQQPPSGATVLFDGTSTVEFEGGTISDEGLLNVSAVTRMSVGDFRMHVEFRLPYMPEARGQGRGNSGVYIQRRYEVQVLDSFGLEGVENECGALYKQQRPLVNMCLPPLSWQTYDIDFRAARWDIHGNKIANARITVIHNGEPVQDDYDIQDKTGAGKPEGPEPMPILFQDHGNPVHFRNIWIVRTGHSLDPCPVICPTEVVLCPDTVWEVEQATCPPIVQECVESFSRSFCVTNSCCW